MERRILGLDPGLAILGFGAICATSENFGYYVTSTSSTAPVNVVATAKPATISPSCSNRECTQSVTLLDFGVIQTTAGTEMGLRLCTIYEDLNTLIQECKPDLVAIEKLFFYRMASTITVAQARGVLMLVLAQHQVPFVEFTPAQIKQALTGYGNADKYEVQQAVARELNLDYVPRPDDAADALAVALTAWSQI